MTKTDKKQLSRKAVVLLSGGIDSSTVLAIAKAEDYDLYAMSFDYHQRHLRELESARKVAESLGVEKHLIITFDMRVIGGSALTSEIDVPKSKIQDTRRRILDNKNHESSIVYHESDSLSHEIIPVTYVPARNTIFLSFALAWAEVLETGTIFVGANAIDYSGYPDCRPEYLKAFANMANLAAKGSVEGKLKFEIKSPLVLLKKSSIIKRGIELGLDYALTWSCYDPQVKKVQSTKPLTRTQAKGFKVQNRSKNHKTQVVPCGFCESCQLRKKGFLEAGVTDPLLSLYTI